MILHAFFNPKNNRIFYVVLIALLLLINGILLWKHFKARADKKALTTQTEALESEKLQVEQQYAEALKNIENLELESASKDSTLADLENSISSQKSEISRLLRKNKLSKSELENARSMISTLQLSGENYQRQIEQLQLANNQLFNEKKELETVLETTKTEAATQIASLETEKSGLIDEKTDLMGKNEKLTNRINRASVLQSDNLKVEGVRYKKNGKEIVTDNSKRVEKLKICFDLLANKVTKSGDQNIYVRIMSPEGSPIVVEDLGSGVMTLTDSGEEIQYTTKGILNYEQSKESYCMYWAQDMGYSEGTYTAQVFHKGFEIGNTKFSLKEKLF